MTYVTLDIFEKMCRAGGVESAFEYMELYRRGIMPTNLVPRVPSVYYLSTKLLPRSPSQYYKPKPKDKRKRVSHAYREILNIFEKKYGRKCNFKDNEDRKLYQKIYREIPEVRARAKAYQHRSDVKAKGKVCYARPEYKARAKAYNQTPEQRARQKAHRQRPEVRAYQKAWRQRRKQ